MRWMELNAFTAVFRTHEGLDPAVSAQFDTNAATLGASRALRQRLQGARGATARGWSPRRRRPAQPVVRHLFLHYPARPQRHGAALPVPARAGPDGGAGARTGGGGRCEVYFPRGQRLDRPLDRRRGGRAGRMGADAGAAGAAGGLPARGGAGGGGDPAAGCGRRACSGRDGAVKGLEMAAVFGCTTHARRMHKAGA